MAQLLHLYMQQTKDCSIDQPDFNKPKPCVHYLDKSFFWGGGLLFLQPLHVSKLVRQLFDICGDCRWIVYFIKQSICFSICWHNWPKKKTDDVLKISKLCFEKNREIYCLPLDKSYLTCKCFSLSRDVCFYSNRGPSVSIFKRHNLKNSHVCIWTNASSQDSEQITDVRNIFMHAYSHGQSVSGEV